MVIAAKAGSHKAWMPGRSPRPWRFLSPDR